MILDIIVLGIPLPLLFKEGTDFAQRLRIVGLVSMGTVLVPPMLPTCSLERWLVAESGRANILT